MSGNADLPSHRNHASLPLMKRFCFTKFIPNFARFAILAGLGGLLVSCATEQTTTKKQVKKDPWGNEERFTVGKDKDGNPVMKSDRRSSMEGKTSHMASNRDFSGQDYMAKSYRKKRWGGNTLFNRKQYSGDTDGSRYKQEPWFVQKQASASGKLAHSNGQAYAVNPYSTSSAYEQGGKRVERTSDAETDVRRRVFKQPDITHWKSQSGLSVSDTNRKLGR